MKAYAKLDEILNVGYLLKVLSILDLKLESIVPFWCHLYGREAW